MGGKKKLISLGTAAMILVVQFGILASTLYVHGSLPAKAAGKSALVEHYIKAKPIYKQFGRLNDSKIKIASHGSVLFTCQNNNNPTPFGCYGPDQIRQAYGVSQLLRRNIDGRRSKIVIIDAFGSPTIQSDLQTFDATWRLPNPTLNVIAPFGVNGSDLGWALETTLDVEWAHAMAQGATINLVIARTNNDDDILNATKYAVENDLGDVISQSFGENESCVDPILLAAEHQVFQEATQKGMSIFASSGDSGSAQPNCSGSALVEAVSSPASDPLVTAVGGTTLTADAVTGEYMGETAWNESSNPDIGAASGGGFSVLYSRPAYQSGVPGQSSGRGVPDVALNASVVNGVLVFITAPVSSTVIVYIVGGTSVGSPEFAALVSNGVQIARHRLGFLNGAIYRLGQEGSRSPLGVFNDITSGDNMLYFSGIPGFRVARGWDPVTGWGSPKTAERLLFGILIN